MAINTMLIPCLPLCSIVKLIRVQEVLRRLRIYLRKFDEFKYFDAALASLALREEGMCPFHACGDFTLRQAHFLAGRD